MQLFVMKNMADSFLSFCEITVLMFIPKSSESQPSHPACPKTTKLFGFDTVEVYLPPDISFLRMLIGLPLPSNGGSGSPNYMIAVHHLKSLLFVVETFVIEYTEGIDGIEPHDADQESQRGGS